MPRRQRQETPRGPLRGDPARSGRGARPHLGPSAPRPALRAAAAAQAPLKTALSLPQAALLLLLLLTQAAEPAAAQGASAAPVALGDGAGEGACLQGKEEARAGRRLAAIASFRRGLSASPDLADCRAALATLLLREHRWREAEQEYRQALSIRNRSGSGAPLLWVGLGETLERQGDLGAAAACYQEALRLDAASPRAIGHLAIVRRRAGDLEGSVAAWKRYLEVQPEDSAALERLEETLRLQAELRLLEEEASRPAAGAGAWEALARARRAAADPRGALEARRRAAEAAPRDPARALWRGIAALEAGEKSEARGSFESVLRLDPDRVVAYAHLARLEEEEGDAAAEARWWERLLEQRPLDRVALERRVELAARAGELDGLEKEAGRTASGKAGAAAALRLALVRAARGEVAGAEAAFALALERSPAEPVVHDVVRDFLRGGGTASERRKGGRAARAAERTGRAERPGPEPSAAGRALLEAHRLLSAGDAATAAGRVSALAAAEPARAELHSALAGMLAAAGKGAEAKSEQERALKLDPGLNQARLWLALHALSAGDAAGAEALARRALELEPRDPRALAALGFALYRRGDLAGAGAAARSALEIDPWEQTAGLRFLLGRALAGQGDLRAAEEAALGELPLAGWLMYDQVWSFSRDLFLDERPAAHWETWRRRPGRLPGGPEEALPRISEFLGGLDERYTRLRTPEETLESYFSRHPDSPELVAGRTDEANRSVISRRLSENLAYLRLADFNTPRLAEVVRQVLEGLKDAPALVLDLRGNPGGLKDEARAVAELLVPPGTLLGVEEQREGGGETRAGPGAGAESGRPLVVLVDEDTGSAAETLAGALQGSGRATIVGETTRGKGVSQAVRLLAGGYSVTVTAGRSFDPAGRPIDEGVHPQTGPAPPGSPDPALEKAREILEKP